MISYTEPNERLHCYARVGLALLLLATFLPAILGGPFASGSLRQRSPAAAPSFEEDQRPLAAARYAWRNSGFTASFQAGGTVLFSSVDGPPGPPHLPGGGPYR